MKNYRPLKEDTTRIQYFVGSGNYDEACFPGNILIWLIDFDHNVALNARKKAAAPQVLSAEEEAADFWKKTILLEYIKPVYEKFVVSTITTIGEFAS